MHNRIADKLFGASPRRDQPATGEAAGDAVRRRLDQSRQAVEKFVAEHPAICLGAAAAAGIFLGWWIKRR